ncbi:hypothetical protein [Stenotrophomonas tumulicola]|uniref:Transmembrane protein n=1 Tax=Stenotrophomonas tumulicola TaxID=1685415 RepID=A0A7W3FMR6_9GAMM|nr:hypothetical protein [Stenotrophomonas tumulicola]MBA8682438.1 hypothetical protein [Stenotrophomonas tumulicola]
MIEQRPTWVAPLLFALCLGFALCAHWLPWRADYRLSLAGVGMVGMLLAAGPAWRWLSAWSQRSPARVRLLYLTARWITGLGVASLLVSGAVGWLWPVMAANGGQPHLTTTQFMVSVASGLLAALCAPVAWRVMATERWRITGAMRNPGWLYARPWQLLVLLACSMTYLGLLRGLDEATRQQLLLHVTGTLLLLVSSLLAGTCVFGCVFLLLRWRLQGLSRRVAMRPAP